MKKASRRVSDNFSVICCALTSNKCIGDDTKDAACRSPNCSRKTKKIRSVLRRYCICDITDICEKLLPYRNFTEIGQLAAELLPKNVILNLKKKLIFGEHLTVIEFQICICLPNFIKIARDNAILRFAI